MHQGTRRALGQRQNEQQAPSSDGLGRLSRRVHRTSGKLLGGQTGHAGHTLRMVEQPNKVVEHRPSVCSQCHPDLNAVAGCLLERRQVLDVPHLRLADPRTSAGRAVLSPLWSCSTICTCRKCSKRLPAPFAVPQELLPFAASVATCRPCTNKDTPCLLR